MSAFAQQFLALHHFLQTHRDAWSQRAFCNRDAPWLESGLRDWLTRLDAETVAHLHQHALNQEDIHPTLRSLHQEAQALSQVQPSRTRRFDAPSIDPRDGVATNAQRFVPERKLRQLAAILARTESWQHSHAPVVDWCGGKGHLGRALGSAWNAPVRVVERTSSVIEDGQKLHAQAGLNTRFFQRDVLQDSVRDALEGAHSVFALHACGELSAQLIEQVDDTEVRQGFWMPCCPHFIAERSHWRALSSVGQAHPLALTTPDLKLAIADEVIARQAHRDARRREQVWRLCADLLLRERLGSDDYVTVGVLPPLAFRGELYVFISQCFAAKGLDAPSKAEVLRASVDAEEELRLVQAFGLVRAVFRRPLELLTLNDRACALEERGWQVQMEELFARTTSPRNVAIIATR